MARLVEGLRGRISGPSPRISRSVFHRPRSVIRSYCFMKTIHRPEEGTPEGRKSKYSPGRGQTAPRTANASSTTSHCPLVFTSRPCFPEDDDNSHGLQANASPPTSSAPALEPPPIRAPELSEKPSAWQTSTAVAGGGVAPSTSMRSKSVGGGWSGTSSRLCAIGLRGPRAARVVVVWIVLLRLLLLLLLLSRRTNCG